jgi:iron complex outermembrane receptor protein
MRKLVMLIAFLATGWCAQAQYTLSGTVSNSQSFPLDGAHIHLDENHATASLPDGTYNLAGITAGSHRIVISYMAIRAWIR